MTEEEKCWQESLMEEALDHIGEAVKCIGMCIGLKSITYEMPECKWTKEGQKIMKQPNKIREVKK